MADVVTDADKKLVESKSDADLQTIIDTYSDRAYIGIRQAAVREQHRRLKEQNERNEKTQNDIRRMTRIILWLTILVVILSIIALVK